MYLQPAFVDGGKTLFRAGIYIGWVGYLNLGDEAIYDLCRNRYPAVSWSLFDTLAYTAKPGRFLHRSTRDFNHFVAQLLEEIATQRRLRSYARKATHRLIRLMGSEIGLCGGGTFINRNDEALRMYMQLRRRTGRPVPTFGTGVAFSDFWKEREFDWMDRRKEWVAALEELPVVGVRGPLSKAQLDDAGARNVVVCADPAVLFHASYVTKSERERRDGPLRVGINAGDCSGRLFGRQEGVQDALVSAARWLRNEGHQVEIIPVWINDVEACVDVARRADLDRSVVTPVCYSPSAFLSRVENLDLFVSLKLHAGILAAAANVPFVSLEYRPKCRDFASTLEWEDSLIRTDQLGKGALIDRISALIPQLDKKRTDLCERMCCLMNRFENYCRTIKPLLLEPGSECALADQLPDTR